MVIGSITSWKKLPEGKRVLVVAPHPDDETIGCGGAICGYRSKGAHVAVVFVTDGQNGLPTGKEKASLRYEESKRALSILDVNTTVALNIPDGKIKNFMQHLEKELQGLVESLEPDVMFLPGLQEEHPDHHMTARAAACLAKYSGLIFQYEVWTPLMPTRVVNITPFMDLKKKALAAYASQVRYFGIDRMAVALNEYRGCRTLGLKPVYAEGFRTGSLKEFHDEFKRFHYFSG